LKEFYELQTFAPDYLFGTSASSVIAGTDETGIPLRPGETKTGFLYHPRKALSADPSDSTNQQFDNKFPYQITLDVQGRVLTLKYQNVFSNGAGATITKEIFLNTRNGKKQTP
jgi:hypothetical protein